MCTKGIVVTCQLMPLISPQSTSPSTNDQHPNQSSVNAQVMDPSFYLNIFFFILL